MNARTVDASLLSESQNTNQGAQEDVSAMMTPITSVNPDTPGNGSKPKARTGLPDIFLLTTLALLSHGDELQELTQLYQERSFPVSHYEC